LYTCAQKNHTEPPAKRRRYFEPEDSDIDSESKEVFDLKSYYDSTTEDRMAEDVQEFISVAFARLRVASEEGKTCKRISKIAGSQSSRNRPTSCRFPGEVLSRTTGQTAFQNSNLDPCYLCPSTDFWPRLCDQGLSGEEDELIPVEEVLKVIQASVALIVNSSNYVSQLRRSIIEVLPADKTNLAKIMKQVCREHWLRALWRSAIKAVSERVNTLETFRLELKLRQ